MINRLGSTIVFTRTRHGADRLAKQLGKIGVDAEPIHGGRSQGQRDRALASFKKGSASALIATDVAARGIHVNGVSAVVHFDPPAEDSTYLHRSGRTARAGATGTVVSLLEGSQKKDAMKLQRGIGISEPITEPRFGSLRRTADGRPKSARRPSAATVRTVRGSVTQTERRPRRRRPTRTTPARPSRSAGIGAATDRRRRFGQVLQLGPRLRVHHPRRRRQGPVRPLLRDHRTRASRRSTTAPGSSTRCATAATATKRSTSASSADDTPRRLTTTIGNDRRGQSPADILSNVVRCVRRPGPDREAHPA